MRMMPILNTDMYVDFIHLNERQAFENHYQSLQALAKRGGMSAKELLANRLQVKVSEITYSEDVCLTALTNIVCIYQKRR